MRVRKSKDKVTDQYKGSLQDELAKAETELAKLQRDPVLDHLRWAYEKAKREYEAKKDRIEQLKGFISLARQKLKEENHE